MVRGLVIGMLGAFAAGGAVIGVKLASPLSRATGRVPGLRALGAAGGTAPGVGNAFARFPGRAVQTGLNNMAASPGGSFLANGLVYGQWSLPTGESLLGAALGGAGRTNTISPFNPDVATAALHPLTALNNATATAANADSYHSPPPTQAQAPDPTSSTPTTDPTTQAAPPPAANSTAGGPNTTGGGTGGGGGNSGGGTGNSTGNGGGNGTNGGTGNGNGHPTGPINNPSASGPPPASPVPGNTPSGTSTAGNPTGSTTGTPPGQPGGTGTGDTPTSTAPPGSTPTSTPPTGTTPTGTTPTGTTPTGTTPTGTTPTGSTPPGTTPPTGPPSGGAPSGGAPSGSSATGGVPSGNPAAAGSPAGSGPVGGVPAGGVPAGAAPDGTAGSSGAVSSGGTAAGPTSSTPPGAATPPTPSGAAPATPPGAASPAPAGPPAVSGPAIGVPISPGTPPGTAPVSPAAQASGTGQAQTGTPGPSTAPDGNAPDGNAPDGNRVAGEDRALVARGGAVVDPRVVRVVDGVVSEVLPVVAPGALPLRDGTVRVRAEGRTTRVPADAVDRVRRRLASRVEDGVPRDRVRAEAAAWLGAAVARAEHRPPMEGALNALGDFTLAFPDTGALAVVVAQDVVGHRWDRLATYDLTDPARLLTSRSAPSPTPPPSGTDALLLGPLDRARQEIIQRIAALTSSSRPQTPPPQARPQTPPPQGGTRPDQRAAQPDQGAAQPDQGAAQPDQGAAQPDQAATRPGQGGSRPGQSAAHAGQSAARPGHGETAAPVHEGVRADQGGIRSDQGMVRRFLGAVNPLGPALGAFDAYVEMRYAEYRRLAAAWDAADAEGRVRRQGEMERLARVLEDDGQVAPVPPWAAGGVRTTTPASVPVPASTPDPARSVPADPDARRVDEVVARIGRVRETLAAAERGLQERSGINRERAAEARTEADKAKKLARGAAKAQDMGHGERRRRHRADRALQRLTADRFERIAKAYRVAAGRAAELEHAYADLAALLGTATPPTGGTTVAAALQAVEEAAGRYREAVARVRPLVEVLPAGVPHGVLPHMGGLTREVNALLEREGVAHRFTAEDLMWELRAEFRRMVTSDGAVLRAGDAEVRVRLRAGEAVEVAEPGMTASEMMVGRLPQGGGWVAATTARFLGAAFKVDPVALARLVPQVDPAWAQVRLLAKYAVLNGRWNRGHLTRTSGGAAEFVLPGQVTDNRGDATMYRMRVAYDVDLRVPGRRDPGRWTPALRVAESLPGDKAELDLWISHAHTEPPAGKQFRLTRAEPGARFPRHAVVAMDGLAALADETVAAIGRGGGGRPQVTLGPEARAQVRMVITEDLPGRLNEAVEGRHGLQRVISDNGRPVGYLRVRTTVRSVPVLVGNASTKQHQEWLGVGFSGANGSATATRSSGVAVTAGVRDPSDAEPGVKGIASLKARVFATVQRSVSRSDGLSSGGMAILPMVRRWMGHSNTHVLTLAHEVTFLALDHGEPHLPVRGGGTALVQSPEPDAARYGWPVDARAPRTANGVPVRNPDGTLVLRDDPADGTPPGRRRELPQWLRPGAGAPRGAGPVTVDLDPAEVERRQAQAEERLRRMGLLPELRPDGMPKLSRVPALREAQLTNMREVAEQLSPNALRTRIDQAAQDGVFFDLVRVRPGLSMEHVTVRVRLTATPDAGYVGVTTAEPHVSLNIGSSSASRSRDRSRGYSAGAGVAAGPPPGTTGRVWTGAEASVQGNWGRGAGWSASNTLNSVTLIESSGQTAVFATGYDLAIDVVRRDGRTEPLLTPGAAPVPARLLVPADLLPRRAADPAPDTQPTTMDMLRRATLLHLDAPGLLPAVMSVLPSSVRADAAAFHHVAAFANVRNLIANPAGLSSGYRTEVVVRPRAAGQTRATLTMEVAIGESTFAGDGDLVTGEIILALGGSSATLSAQRGAGGNASTGLGTRQADGSGGGLGVNGGVSGGRSHAVTHATTSGREQLTVETGRKNHYLMTAEIKVTGHEAGSSRPRKQTVSATVLYALPERDALLLYGESQMSLPLHQVADAVQRYLNGDLRLDPAMAVRVARRYVAEREAALTAGTPVGPLVARHTPETLFTTMADRIDPPSARSKDLADLLTRRRPRTEVTLPAHFRDSMALTTFETVDLAGPDGTPMEPFDAVMRAVAAVAPEAAGTDPVLWRAMFGDLAGENWWGKIDDMAASHGFEWALPVRVGPHRTDQVRITVRVGMGEGAVMLEGKNDEVVHISQQYAYRLRGRSASSSRSGGFGVSGDASGGGHGGNFGAGTDRGLTRSASGTEQRTLLQRAASFDGADRISHDVTVEIEVSREPLPPSRPPGRLTRPLHAATAMVTKALDGGSRRLRSLPPPVPAAGGPVRITLTGRAVRLVPDGLTAPARRAQGEPSRFPDPRQAPLPETYFTETTRAESLIDAVRERLAGRDLLGPQGVREHWVTVGQELAPMARTANFRLMTDPDGHHVLRLPVPGSYGEVVDVWVRARPSEPRLVVGPRAGVELGRVDRQERRYESAVERGRMLPLGVNGGLGQDASGTAESVSAGEQSGDRASSSGGNRNETSLFLKGSTVTAAFRVDFDVAFERRTVRGDGTERPGRRATLPAPVTGTAHLMMPAAEYEHMLRHLESAPAPSSGWDLGEDRPARRLPWRRAAAGTPHVLDEVLEAAGRTLGPDAAAGMEEVFRAVADEVRRRAAGRGPVSRIVSSGAADMVSLVTSSTAADLPLALTWARVLARELRAPVRITVDERGQVRGYVAAPDGGLTAEDPDGGFAAAFATLPPEVWATARAADLDLRELFNRTASDQHGFADRVRAELTASGVPVPRVPDPMFPTVLWGPGPGQITGSTLGGVGTTAPGDPGSGFVKSRPPEAGPVTEAEMRAAWAEVRPSDIAGGYAGSSFPDGDPLLRVDVRGLPRQHYRPVVGELPGDLMARTERASGTEADPHVLTVDPRVPADHVTRAMLHEVGHSIRALNASAPEAPQRNASGTQAAPEGTGPRQGVIRPSLTTGAPEAAEDACVAARTDEYRYLSRRWTEAAPDARPELRRQLEGLARVITARGHVPPPPPWAAPDPGESRADFWNRMRKLANTTGWDPPDEEDCACPQDGPCRCGRRPAQAPAPARAGGREEA
ncbi:hypothetical protein GCM10009677_51560 [Sphaerisporangium rubeum]|uniref:hypothetical protein n=1 Tax=Sphaerisporangium rubeum TaxID=321317 RepID=UPI0031D2B63B